MSEYRVCPHCRKPITDGWIETVEYVVNVRVVRCRDCKYSDAIKTRYQQETVYACLNFDSAAIEPDGFCAWGERKEGGDD